MTETRISNTAEQLLRDKGPSPPAKWMKPRLLESNIKTQSRLAHHVDDSGARSASVRQPDEAFIHALSDYSKSTLHSIVLGNNSDNENRLLREIYWHTIEALANQG